MGEVTWHQWYPSSWVMVSLLRVSPYHLERGVGQSIILARDMVNDQLYVIGGCD